MKKIILFLAILSVGFISSCSKDDDSNGNTPDPNPNPTPDDVFSAKVNGVLKNFTVTDVKVLEYPAYTDIEITAHVVNDPTITFELNFSRDYGEIYFAQYLESGNYFNSEISDTFPVVITKDSAEEMTGTFSGTLEHDTNAMEPVTITEGFFKVYFDEEN